MGLRAEEQNKLLASIHTRKDADAAFASLLNLSKQGKLAGYVRDGDSGCAVVDAHGTPFDSDLLIEYTEGRVDLSLSMRKRMPTIFTVLLLFSIWPGLPLTDSFMYNFEWYERLMGDSYSTWMWYLPMTVIPMPFVWRSSIKKSRVSAHEHAMETVEKIRAALS
tara:strand:- start:47449 stop:47940 length:492 start_codon:yes stop_codon:yes gene_type:complete